jgi:hypothetical protein
VKDGFGSPKFGSRLDLGLSHDPYARGSGNQTSFCCTCFVIFVFRHRAFAQLETQTAFAQAFAFAEALATISVCLLMASVGCKFENSPNH